MHEFCFPSIFDIFRKSLSLFPSYLKIKISINPLVPSENTLDQNFYFKIRKEHQKNSYERRAYESVDIRSLFWVISHRSTESSTPVLKGLTG